MIGSAIAVLAHGAPESCQAQHGGLGPDRTEVASWRQDRRREFKERVRQGVPLIGMCVPSVDRECGKVCLLAQVSGRKGR